MTKQFTITEKNGQTTITTFAANEVSASWKWDNESSWMQLSTEVEGTNYTTDSMFIDQISDMKADNASWDEIQNAYKEKAFDSLEESIVEWCEEINEKEEENA